MRECAQLLRVANFIPVIEPVKESTSGLKRAVEAITEADGQAVLVVNPQHGSFRTDTTVIREFVDTELGDHPGIGAGIILHDGTPIDEVLSMCERHQDRPITLIHAGFSDARALTDALPDSINHIRHIFWDGMFGKLYQRYFRDAEKILLKDGFEVRPNREHPPVEFFSDLHITYEDHNMEGFGDFLIVGRGYSETGGPAYAVAIHITFLDPDKDDTMFVHHFVSDRQDTPTDPAGKFAEALQKLIREVENPASCIHRGNAIEEFVDLARRGHYPGLGYVKKLSMQHHLETLAAYFAAKQPPDA